MYGRFKKCGILFFFSGKVSNIAFSRDIRKWSRHFLLKMIPSEARDHFGKKCRDHFLISQENAILDTFPKKKKIISSTFLIGRTLVFLCHHQPFGGLCFCVCVCVLIVLVCFGFSLFFIRLINMRNVCYKSEK